MKCLSLLVVLLALADDPILAQNTHPEPGGGRSTPTQSSSPPSQQSPSYGLSSVRDLSQSPWFALTSGLASILGLLLTLYATQVRTIPFSLYRSLMWRKVLLIASGVGLLRPRGGASD
jgi:hypothetical protein